MKTGTFLWLLLVAAWGCLTSPAQAQTCVAPTSVSVSSPAPATVAVSFTPVATASLYVVRYFWTGDSTASGIRRRITSSSPVTLTGLRPAAHYVVRVGSICGGDTVYAAPRLVLTSSGPAPACAAVTNAHVSNVTSTGAMVSFTPVSGAISYTISSYAVGDSTNIHTTNTTIPDTVFTGLPAGTSYIVRIRANCGGGATSSSVIITFRTLTSTVPCGAVTNVVVTGTSSSTATVSFTPGTGNTSFSITYHAAGDSTRRVNVTSSPAVLTGLVMGRTYYVQVVSQCGQGSSTVYTNSSSTPFNFRGAAPLSTRNALGAGTLDAYPNPAHGVMHLRVPAVPGATTAQVTLLNALGQPLKTRQLTLGNTDTEVQLNVEGVALGLYTLRLLVGGQQASQRVAIE